MASGFTDRFYLKDGNNLVVSVTEPPETGTTVYEIIKIVAGIPLFYEDHIARLHNSLKIAGFKDYPLNSEDFRQQVIMLCQQNNKYFGNVELRLIHRDHNLFNSFVGFVPHKYPGPVQYIEGVKVQLLEASRENPNAKIKDTLARVKSNEYLASHNVFEVLLVNKRGYVTEGSRSNLFFIKNNAVSTAPYKSVLPGITRKYVIQAVNYRNYILNEEVALKSGLNDFDAAFLSGTSLGILPIQQIDDINFNVQNSCLQNLMLEFNNIVQSYLHKNS